METVIGVQQHDARTLTRITLAAEAAVKLKVWKKKTWTEVRGEGTGYTGMARAAAQDILAACQAAVGAFGVDTLNEFDGSFHAVIVAESGELLHATMVGCDESGRFYLAG